MGAWELSATNTALNRAEGRDLLDEELRAAAKEALSDLRPWDEYENSPAPVPFTDRERAAAVTALRDYYEHVPSGRSIMGDNDETRERIERALRSLGSEPPDDSDDDRLSVDERACNHARDHCEHGDPDACEFLTDACGYDDEEVAAILDEDSPDAEQDIEGQAAGAIGRAWQGYKAAVSRLAAEIDDALEAKRNAEQAAAAINAIRADHGQEPIELERLEELSDRLAVEGDRAHDAEGHTEQQNS